MTHPSDAGSMSRGHHIRRVAAMLSSALLVAALFVACGPSSRSAAPTENHATASTSATASSPGSGSQSAVPAVSTEATAQPSGAAASAADPLGSDLSNLDQLLNGMDDSLSQAGPSASGE